MVERQLRRRGIGDARVLAAMEAVPRERFLAEDARSRAYEDTALPIGAGQTISQPWIVAAICQALALEGGERVLEVGTGCGYSAAVLARLAATVVSLERLPELAESARANLAAAGAEGVRVVVGDGSLGLSGEGPFDAIAVHATAPAPPPALLGQLAPAGRLVLPVAGREVDELTLISRRGEGWESEPIAPCRFVPLIGAEGFAAD